MSNVYVRAKNAAYYLNPILSSPRGMVTFAEGLPALVIWKDRDNYDQALEVAAELLGDSGQGWAITRLITEREMPVVTTQPPHRVHQARVYAMVLSRRIPTPLISGGDLRYRSRIPAGTLVIDADAHPDDANEI